MATATSKVSDFPQIWFGPQNTLLYYLKGFVVYLTLVHGVRYIHVDKVVYLCVCPLSLRKKVFFNIHIYPRLSCYYINGRVQPYIISKSFVQNAKRVT